MLVVTHCVATGRSAIAHIDYEIVAFINKLMFENILLIF